MRIVVDSTFGTPSDLIVDGPKLGEGDAAEFDMIRVRRINYIEPNGRIRRAAGTGWLPL